MRRELRAWARALCLVGLAALGLAGCIPFWGDAEPAPIHVDNQSGSSIYARVSGADSVVPARTEVSLAPGSWDGFVVTINTMGCTRLGERGFTHVPFVRVVVDAADHVTWSTDASPSASASDAPHSSAGTATLLGRAVC